MARIVTEVREVFGLSKGGAALGGFESAKLAQDAAAAKGVGTYVITPITQVIVRDLEAEEKAGAPNAPSAK